MNFNEQSEAWLAGLEARRSKPIAPSSLAKYRSTLKKWILPRVGDTDLSTFANGALKAFVDDITKTPMAPKTLQDIVGTVKALVASAQDSEGDPLYPRKWNTKFIDLPTVDKKKQKTPTVTKEQLSRAMRITQKNRVLYALLAGSGLRIGEALAIRVGDDGVHTCFDYTNKVIHVRTQFWRGVEKGPKTPAGVRSVDLCSRLSSMLAEYASLRSSEHTPFAHRFLFVNAKGGRLRDTALRIDLAELDIGGFHAFRRFRNTYLLETGVHRNILQYWMGHEKDKTMTDRYSKLADDLDLRKTWAERVGLGFTVPKISEEEKEAVGVLATQ